VAGFLLPVELLLETTPQPITAHALQVKQPTTTLDLKVEELATACAL